MTTATQPNAEETTKVWEMIKKIGICMLVTRDGDAFSGRPMSTIAKPDLGAVYLLTEASTSAVSEISAAPSVLLSYQSSSDHVALTGRATVHDDLALVKSLWSPGAEAFWPDGPETSNVVAIAVRDMTAEYWDGPNPVVGAAKFLLSLATGSEPDMGHKGHATL